VKLNTLCIRPFYPGVGLDLARSSAVHPSLLRTRINAGDAASVVVSCCSCSISLHKSAWPAYAARCSAVFPCTSRPSTSHLCVHSPPDKQQTWLRASFSQPQNYTVCLKKPGTHYYASLLSQLWTNV